MRDTVYNGFRLSADPVDSGIYLQLMEDCFKVRFSVEWFHWFHFESPWGASRIYTAWKSDQLVSTVAALPLCLLSRNTQFPGSLYVDAMTHPDFHKKGLYTALLEHSRKDATHFGEAFSIAFAPATRHSMKGMLNIGWQLHEDVFHWELSRSPAGGTACLSQVSMLDACAQPLLDNFNQDIRFGVLKSVEFLNWRTACRPDIQYELYQHKRNGTIHGILILKHYHTDMARKTHILEAIAADSASYQLLLQASEARAAAMGSQCLNLWVSDHEMHRPLLADYGFAPTQEKNLLLTDTYEEGLYLDSSPHDHIALVDNDVY